MSDTIRACPLCQWVMWIHHPQGHLYFECRARCPTASVEQVAWWPSVSTDDWCRLFELCPTFADTDPQVKQIVYLPNAVYGDGPFANTVALSGNHIAHTNKHGAVSVVAKDGTLLGIKPDEFEWLEKKPQ